MVGIVTMIGAAGLVIAVVHLLARVFHGVPMRVWAAVLALSAIAVVVWVRATQRDELVGASCEVRKPEVRDSSDRTIEVWAKLRWTVDGKPITTYQPMRLASGKPAERAALEQQYPAGSRVECSYFAGMPNRIYAEDARSKRALVHATAVGGWIGAVLLVGAAVHAWIVARRRRRVRTWGLRGAVGAASVLAIVGGMLAKTGVSYVLAGAGLVVGIALIVREVIGSDRAFARIRKQLASAKHWPAPQRASSSGGWNPYEDDRVTGTYRGRKVWVALHASGATVKARLDGWPGALELARRVHDDEPRTGDEGFDRVVQLAAADDATWRAVLSSKVRAQMITIFETWHARIANAVLEVELGDGETDAMQAALDAATSIDVLELEDLERRVFELARSEPNATVRAGHYRWLVGHSWNPPLVYRAAAEDDDLEIAAWGKAELPPDGGAFR
ncbi:MAG: hypothetical protein H0T89_34860 [Deltaproteobacteria bacterium]|nr:hypothetical protein [Deltaproteobacteria bacterium]